MRIEFLKVIRDCDQNKSILEVANLTGKTPRNLIYDFNVIIDGEHRATWRRHAVGRGYYLAPLEGRALQWPPDPSKRHRRVDRMIRAASQSLFDQMTRKALDGGLIPPRAQHALVSQQMPAGAEYGEQADIDRALRINGAAGELYIAASIVIKAFSIGTFNDQQARAMSRLIDAVAKAEAMMLRP
jgi:hypothetical protein